MAYISNLSDFIKYSTEFEVILSYANTHTYLEY